jgi:hypothetical protein
MNNDPKLLGLADLDPATEKAGAELNALMATEVLEWKQHNGYWVNGKGKFVGYGYVPTVLPMWSPSTNPAHAIDVILKAVAASMNIGTHSCEVRIVSADRWHRGYVDLDETNGNKAEAMAQAICRAWLGALKAKEAKGGK